MGQVWGTEKGCVTSVKEAGLLTLAAVFLLFYFFPAFTLYQICFPVRSDSICLGKLSCSRVLL